MCLGPLLYPSALCLLGPLTPIARPVHLETALSSPSTLATTLPLSRLTPTHTPASTLTTQMHAPNASLPQLKRLLSNITARGRFGSSSTDIWFIVLVHIYSFRLINFWFFMLFFIDTFDLSKVFTSLCSSTFGALSGIEPVAFIFYANFARTF